MLLVDLELSNVRYLKKNLKFLIKKNFLDMDTNIIVWEK